MMPLEPEPTTPKTFAINSSRDMLEKLKREIEQLAGSIIRQEIELEVGSWRDVEEHAEICYRSPACGVHCEEHRL